MATDDQLSELLARVGDPVSLLEGFFRHAPVGLQIYSVAGRSVLTNRMFREIFGSEPPPEYNVLRDEIAERSGILGLIRRAFAGETITTPPVWYDPRELSQVRVSEGRRVAMTATFFPLRDARGAVEFVAVVFRDVTAETLAREQLEAEREELRRDAELRERFIGILGHDLRTPLSAVTITASMLTRQGGTPEPLRGPLVRIAAAAARMERMIRDLLDLTRARHGGIPIDVRPCDLGTLARQVVAEVESAHPGRRIEFHSEGDARGAWDADRVAQTVANLLVNAVMYSPTGSVVRVDVRGDTDGDAVQLTVHNEGPPIASEFRARLFDPFRRARNDPRAPSASGGLGLGLYIVDQVARAHGGSVTLTSTADEGTTVTVRLPRTAPARAPETTK